MGCEVCGWAAAFVSMLAFGSFGVPIKSERAKSVNIDPLVFQSYKTAMCFLTCWLVLFAGVPFTYSPWGIVSGLFWVPGGTATVYAIKEAGIAIGIGTGSCFIVLVSFIWGIFIFEESVKSKFLASFAVFCLMGGLFGMAYFSSPEAAGDDETPPSVLLPASPGPMASVPYSEITRQEDSSDYRDDIETESTTLSANLEKSIKTTERTVRTNFSDSADSLEQEITNRSNGAHNAPLSVDENDENDDDDDDTLSVDSAAYHSIAPTYVIFCGVRIPRRTSGILAAALVTGVWGGSILVPMHWAGDHTKGVEYLISFAIGASIITLAMWALRLFYNAYHYKSLSKAYASLPSFHIRVMWLPGGISGFLWSVGNLSSILAVYYLGEGVGYPLSQTSILVSGLWGIFYFEEVKGKRKISLWILCSTLAIAGILLLSYEHVERRQASKE